MFFKTVLHIIDNKIQESSFYFDHGSMLECELTCMCTDELPAGTLFYPTCKPSTCERVCCPPLTDCSLIGKILDSA